jgi:uncharacterized protein YejL (UPF0352 family)
MTGKTLEELAEDLAKYSKKPKEQVLKELKETAEKHGAAPEKVAEATLKAWITCQ